MSELIETPTLSRLRCINQFGYAPFWKNEAGADISRHSRFGHSVGVCLLLERFGAGREEQAAGLIHDVSHTAFSHCTEYVLGLGNIERQSYQDSIFEGFVRRSEIPGILSRNGIDPEFILDDGNFPLKERALPDLCADRIDYVLRDAFFVSILKKEDADYFLSHLNVDDGLWSFSDCESARKFAGLFQLMNDKYYAGISSAKMFRAVGDFLRYALEMGYIDEEDFWLDDIAVTEKAKRYLVQDDRLQLLFDRMEGRVGLVASDDPDVEETVCKSRVVDPFFRDDDGELKRLSDCDMGWKEALAEESKPRRYRIVFER